MELKTIYLLRDEEKISSACHVIPKGGEKKYCVIQSPSLQLQGSASTAFLVEISLKAGGSGGREEVVERQRPRQWDQRLLWGFCRWRSCLSHGARQPGFRQLCVHHSGLKRHIDSRSSKVESNRFLPKRPPVRQESGANAPSLEDDLYMIKAASSLLDELASGKLAQTIDSFCQRASVEASDRTWAEHSNLARSSPSPSWSSKRSSSRLATIESGTKTATEVLRNEEASTAELRKLATLSVFPTAELALLRRSGGNVEEVEASHRKLSLLQLRRHAAEEQQLEGHSHGPL